jgi:hypothetical protein
LGTCALGKQRQRKTETGKQAREPELVKEEEGYECKAAAGKSGMV